jgi:DNA-directed RNA polymerase subunit L
MAKKKANKTEDKDDEEIENVYPKLEDAETVESISPSAEQADEEEEFELEEEPRFPDYKYLSLELIKGQNNNDYELIIEGQSHGFCNILVKHLLKTEGVNSAAYKATNIAPAKIFIRLENSKSYKIKDILHKSIESLREEVIQVQKLFKKLR